METLIRMFREEPVLVVDVVKALIGVLAAFGLILAGAQTAAVVALVGAVIVVVGAFIEREQVTPIHRARRRGR